MATETRTVGVYERNDGLTALDITITDYDGATSLLKLSRIIKIGAEVSVAFEHTEEKSFFERKTVLKLLFSPKKQK